MQQKGKNKPAAVKAWEATMMDYDGGCVVNGDQHGLVLHHVFGYTYVHNKILIGPWYVLPLCERYHNSQMGNPFCVHIWPKRFSIEFGYQRDKFIKRINEMQDCDIILPFGDDVINAIADSPYR